MQNCTKINTQFLDANGLRGARIGVARKYFGFSEAVDSLMNQVIDEMKSAGAVIVDPADLESHGKFDDTELLVLLYELKADLNSYLATRQDGNMHSPADLISFNEKNKEKEMPYFGQDLFLKAQEKGPLTTKEYVDALAANRSLSREHGIDGVMDKFRLDAVVAPTGGPAWLTDSCQWRSLSRRQFKRSSGGRLSQHQCPCRIGFRAAGGDFILRKALE